MQLMEQFYHPVQPKTWREDPLLTLRIHNAIAALGIPCQINSSSQLQMKATLQLRCRLPLQRVLTSFWVFTVREHLEMNVELVDLQSQTSSGEVSPQVTALLKHFNLTTHGLYYLNKNNHNIVCFRLKLPFDTSKRYLQSHFKEIYLQVSHQFSKFAVTAKLVEAPEQTPSTQIIDTLQRLRVLKEEFQFARQQRKRSTNCYNLANSHIKLVSQALSMINLCFGKLKLYARETKIDLSRCHKIYSAIKKAVEEAAGKENEKLMRFIVQGIHIEDIFCEEAIDEGGSSIIHRGIYHFRELLTYNNNIPKFEKEQNHNDKGLISYSKLREEDEGELKRVLVRKIPKNQKDTSFQNQFELLKFLRNQRCSNIADYYLSNSTNPAFNSGIYMQFYQTNLAKIYHMWNERQLLKVSRQILQGIYFFWRNKVLHRDVKELNVLIDQAGNAKLIDFGSSSGFNTNGPGQFSPNPNRLMATKGYFFNYSHIDIPAITSKFQREEFHQAETFDMYSFGQILNNLFYLENAQDGLVQRQLTFLARKCQEINPEDRIYPTEALCYLRQILTLFIQENNIQAEEEQKSGEDSLASKKSTHQTSQQQ